MIIDELQERNVFTDSTPVEDCDDTTSRKRDHSVENHNLCCWDDGNTTQGSCRDHARPCETCDTAFNGGDTCADGEASCTASVGWEDSGTACDPLSACTVCYDCDTCPDAGDECETCPKSTVPPVAPVDPCPDIGGNCQQCPATDPADDGTGDDGTGDDGTDDNPCEGCDGCCCNCGGTTEPPDVPDVPDIPDIPDVPDVPDVPTPCPIDPVDDAGGYECGITLQ